MKKWMYFLPALLFYFLIFLVSSRDIHLNFDIDHLDKVAHVFEFSFLGLLLAIGFFNAFSWSSSTKSVLTFGSGLILGILDEFHQLFVHGRQSDIKDVMADATGLVLGILVFRYLEARRKPADRKPG
jgi:VanZ family protein